MIEIQIGRINATLNKGNIIILNAILPIHKRKLCHIPQDSNYKYSPSWVPELSEPNLSAVRTSPVPKIPLDNMLNRKERTNNWKPQLIVRLLIN